MQKYGTIYADPPWQYGNQSTRSATDRHYETLPLSGITGFCVDGFHVSDLADDDSHLHLWTTNGFLESAFSVITAWGFTFKSCMVWVKPEMGIGNYWRVSQEFLMLGTRGDDDQVPF